MIPRLSILGLIVVVAACGGGTGPAAPSVLQIGGTWNVTATLASSIGGECLANAADLSIGATLQFPMQVTQSGSAVSSTMASCSYAGTATADGFTLSLLPGPCTQLNANWIVCTNGAARLTQVVSRTLSFTVTGNAARGTRTETTNVITATSASDMTVVGAAVRTESLTASR
jgi:hypothetical protein